MDSQRLLLRMVHPWESTLPVIILTMMMWVMIGYVVAAVPHPLRLLRLGRQWKDRESLVIVGSLRSSRVTIDGL